jgi:hypothetical protein
MCRRCGPGTARAGRPSSPRARTALTLITRDKILLTLMLTAVAAIVGSFVYARAFREHLPYGDERCDRLAAVASDPQKVKYVREWVAARMQDERFMTVARQSPYFDRRDPTMWRYIDLDSRRLGFDPTLVLFNDGFGADVRANGLRYSQIHLGRPSIIIQVNPTADLEAEWSAADRGRLRAFGDGAVVFCDLE